MSYEQPPVQVQGPSYYNCQAYMTQNVRWEHDENSHAHCKDYSKHLAYQQIEAIHISVRISPAQIARSFQRNLLNFSSEKQINPNKIRNICRKVFKFWADLILEQLDHHKIDYCFK